MSGPLLQVEDLRVWYRQVPAVRGVSLSVSRGEIVGLFGNNGAGKTSTLDAVMGVVSGRTSGRILWAGQDISGSRPHQRRKLGIVEVPEGRHVFPRMTVHENMEVALLGSPVERGRYQSRLDAMYEVFPPLAGRRKQLAGSLSGGEAQMLAVSRGLIGEPKLLLIDEPSLGLAPVVTRNILSRLKLLARQESLSVLVSEQKLKPTVDICQQAGVLDRGSLGFWGPAAELLSDPDMLRRTYLGSTSVVRA